MRAAAVVVLSVMVERTPGDKEQPSKKLSSATVQKSRHCRRCLHSQARTFRPLPLPLFPLFQKQRLLPAMARQKSQQQQQQQQRQRQQPKRRRHSVL
jgi:hypothetical protein